MKKTDVGAVLLMTCDKNMDVLQVMKNSMDKYWRTRVYPLYVATETRTIQWNNAKFILSDEAAWSNRLHSALSEIPEEVILLLLDDFIIEENVDEERLASYMQCFQEDDSIAAISLAEQDENLDNAPWLNAQHPEVRKRRRSKYLLSLQAGIWGKNKLMTLLRDAESPWECELYGSIRALKHTEWKFYSVDKAENSPLIYNRGFLVVQGAWLMSEVRRLNEKCGLSINVNGRKVFADKAEVSKARKRKFWYRIKRKVSLLLYSLHCELETK